MEPELCRGMNFNHSLWAIPAFMCIFEGMKLLLTLSIISFNIFISKAQIPSWKITDVENYIDSSQGVVVVNMWATFCKPCVAELPGFIRIVNEHKNDKVKLLMVSLDLPSFYPKKIASFAVRKNFNSNIVWLNESNADYFCPRIDSAWSGSIPATLFVNTRTGYRRFFEEELDAVTFEAELKKAIRN